MPVPYTTVLISHTSSTKDRNVQSANLKVYFKSRGGDVEKADVQFLDDGNTTPGRRRTIQAWVDKNPKAAIYRNGLLTPCETVVTRKPGVVNKKKAVQPKKGDNA